MAAIPVDAAPPSGNLLEPMMKNVIDIPSGPYSARISRERFLSDNHRASIALLMTAKGRRFDVWVSASSKPVIQTSLESVSAESKCGGKFLKRTNCN